MAAFSVQVTGLDKVLARMKELPAKLDEAEKRSVLRGQVAMGKKWINNVKGTVLRKRTGAYAAAIQPGPLTKTATGYEGRVGAVRGKVDPYAAIHETGGTIKAKKKLLAIPLERTRAGVQRDSTPRDYPDGFWFRSKRGTMLFGVRTEDNTDSGADGIRILFVGKESVKIPARRPMGRAFDEIRPTVVAEFNELIRRATRA